MGIREHTVRRMAGRNDDARSASSRSSSSSRAAPQQRSQNQNPSSGNNARPAAQNRSNDTSWDSSGYQSNQNQSNNTWNQSNQNNRNNNTSGNSSGYQSNQNRSNNTWNQSSATNSNAPAANGGQNFNWTNESGGEIVCNCHEPAKMLTVRKEGPNQGINLRIIFFNDLVIELFKIYRASILQMRQTIESRLQLFPLGYRVRCRGGLQFSCASAKAFHK